MDGTDGQGSDLINRPSSGPPGVDRSRAGVASWAIRGVRGAGEEGVVDIHPERTAESSLTLELCSHPHFLGRVTQEEFTTWLLCAFG